VLVLKLYIVEDEKICRDSLINLPWDQIGVKVIGSAANATMAFDDIKQNRPDIVISDIRMPHGTGIELAQKLYVLMPDIKIIFLTAHNDFDYAIQAIKYGVWDYILKPIDTQQILDSVKRAVNAILDEQKQKTDLEKFSIQLQKNKHFLKSYFLDMLNHKVNHTETLKFFDITPEHGIFTTVVVSFHQKDEEIKTVDYFNIFEQINKVIKPEYPDVIAFYDPLILTYIFAFNKGTSEDDALSTTINTAEIIQQYLEFNTSNPFTVGIGEVVSSIDRIPFCYKRACEAIKYHFYLGENKVIYINDMEPANPATEYKINIDEKLYDAIKIGDEASSHKIIQQIFESFKRNQVDIDIIQRACLEIFVNISTLMVQLGQNPNILFNKTEIWTVLKKHQTIESLQQLTYDVISAAISAICFNRNTKNHELIEKVKKIIHENYHSDISLNEIAKQVYISPCYLSVIFSNETNTTYKNYIMQTRIEKAKELLVNSDLNIYEIADKVGYKSQKYFSFLFHKITGMMPTEYRAKYKI